MKLPYNHEVVQNWFTKEIDYLLFTHDKETGRLGCHIAGLFLPYRDANNYVWMEKSTERFIRPETITHYMIIPQ